MGVPVAIEVDEVRDRLLARSETSPLSEETSGSSESRRWYTRGVGAHLVELRHRVLGWRNAQRREMAQRAIDGPMHPDASLDAATEMYALFSDAVRRSDAIRTREVAAARAAWRRLRSRRPWPTAGTTRR